MKKISRKNARKTLLRSSFIMLMVSVITLSSATYAWFTTGKSAQVTDMVFSAVAASGVEFSADAFHSGAKTTIDADDIYSVINDGVTDWVTAVGANPQAGSLIVGSNTLSEGDPVEYQLNPVSTVNTAAAGALSFYKATINGPQANITEAANGTPANSYYYYKFNLFVRASGDAYDTLYLDLNNSTVLDTSGKETSFATRVAVIDQGNATTPTSAVALAGGTTAAIWEPKADRHTDYAINNRGAADGVRYAYNALTAAGAAVELNNGFVPAGDNAAAATSTQYDYGYLKVGGVSDSKITKLTVYVWIEGQDIDCENVIASGVVSLNLKFIADKEVEGEPSLAKTVTLSALPGGIKCYGAPSTWNVSDETNLKVVFEYPASTPNMEVKRGAATLTVDVDYTWSTPGSIATLTINKEAITADLTITVTLP